MVFTGNLVHGILRAEAAAATGAAYWIADAEPHAMARRAEALGGICSSFAGDWVGLASSACPN